MYEPRCSQSSCTVLLFTTSMPAGLNPVPGSEAESQLLPLSSVTRALDVPPPLGELSAPPPDVLGVQLPLPTRGGISLWQLRPPGSQFCPRFAAGTHKGRAVPAPTPHRRLRLRSLSALGHSPRRRSSVLSGAARSKYISGPSGSQSPRPRQGSVPASRPADPSRWVRTRSAATRAAAGPGPARTASVLQSPAPAMGCKHRSPPIWPSLTSGHGQSLVIHPLIPTGPTPQCRHRLSLRPA
ncbi:hypothetical protein NDU88_006070 [Pleurodeles waltl]|uniref:Uncharacterized protein n=1 Tax=Pleurodeles waltl TaxID=8319 RepID=A0AAV7MB69_PLEWA|nr:hypothetical protein NDU88_006070 [Pleurodeles waltl]